MAVLSLDPYKHCLQCVDETLPWLVRPSTAGGYWVTNGEWEPGHASLVRASADSLEEALAVAQDHNRKLPKGEGRPPLPFSGWLVRSAMERADWNISAAARALGVSRMTLHRWFVDREKVEGVTKHSSFVTHQGKNGATP